MAASGVYTLALTVNEAAKSTFELLQAVGDGESLTGDHSSDFMRAGNLILKSYQADGLHLWATIEGSLFMEVGQGAYDFRLSSTKKSNVWYETTSTAATLAGVYVVPVTSAANIQVGDTFGVIQNDNNLFWSTVSIVAALNITLNDPVPLPSLSGAVVRNYRDTFIPISRVLKGGIRRKEASTNEIPIVDASREEYYNLPNKSQKGTPIQVYYDRQDVAGEKYGVMNVWSPPSSSKPVINFTYERKIQIMTDADETIDIPDYAQEAFIYAVAMKLIPKYGASPEKKADIKQEAYELRQNLLSFDSDSDSLTIKFDAYG